MKLQGRVAIITGSSRGIGAATARAFAQEGAAVVINYHQSKDKAEELVNLIVKEGGKAIAFGAEVTHPQQAQKLVQDALFEMGQVDILVNNAAIGFPIKPFMEFTWEDLEKKLVQEIKATFNMSRAVLPHMISRRQGKIINISSGLSRYPAPGFVAHCTAKSGLDAMSKVMALELGSLGISVNVVAPGLTITDATAFLPAEYKQQMAEQTPLRRNAEPEDVAKACLFFASEWSQFVTGQYLHVSGGNVMI